MQDLEAIYDCHDIVILAAKCGTLSCEAIRCLHLIVNIRVLYFSLPLTEQMSYQKPDPKKLQELSDIANKMRIHSVNMTQASGSGYVSFQT